MEPIRVVIADDHEIVRYALRTLLEGEPDIEVVGEASDGLTVVDVVASQSVDVLLLDMRMPGQGGIEACRQVRKECPGTRVLALTSFDEDDDVFGVLAAGATGYLLKDTKPDRLVEAIRSVADGQAVLDPKVANRVIANQHDGNGRTTAQDVGLSDREAEVLGLMSKGLSNKEIGQALWIGETTVKTHVSHILRKLDQSDRTQAVLAAVQLGIITLERREPGPSEA